MCRLQIHPAEFHFRSSQEPWRVAQAVSGTSSPPFFFSIELFFSMHLLLPPWRWKEQGGKKVMKMFGYALWVLHLFVYVAERKWERERDYDRERVLDRERDEMCDLICSPGASLQSRRQSSPWRHLKTQMDGKLWCISNTPVIHT